MNESQTGGESKAPEHMTYGELRSEAKKRGIVLDVSPPEQPAAVAGKNSAGEWQSITVRAALETAVKDFLVLSTKGEVDQNSLIKTLSDALTGVVHFESPLTLRKNSEKHAPLVIPEWFASMPLQQQSVVNLATRGPDGVRKYHPCKEVVRAYRGTVIRAAKYGRMLRWGEKADSFMSMDVISDDLRWEAAVNDYYDSVDELPHHYHLHLLHAAQIVGARHPDERLRSRWESFYLRGCEDAHMNPETPEQLDARLNDWGEVLWELEKQPTVLGRVVDY